MAIEHIIKAKKEKNDEFYTQYQDIQKEMNAYVEYNPDIFKGKTEMLGGIILIGIGLKILIEHLDLL